MYPKHWMDQKVASLIKHVSIKLLDWGLNQQRCNVLHYGEFNMNLLSCMTLELEHLHSTFNHKQGFQAATICSSSTHEQWQQDAWMDISKWCCSKTAKSSTRNNYGKNRYITRGLLSRGIKRPSVTKGCNGAIDSKQESMESETDNIDEMVQYDTDVYEQEIIQNEIGNKATFLFGANSQFCRSIKFNRTFF